jgi:hypothetical protein
VEKCVQFKPQGTITHVFGIGTGSIQEDFETTHKPNYEDGLQI